MLKPILISTLLIISCATSKAQYATYKPLPIPSGDNSNVPPSYRKENSNTNDGQRLSGYVINVTAQTVRKINLQVINLDHSTLITGFRELQDNYWTSFTVNRPVAEKLSYGELFSNKFEFKVYIPSLGQTVYF